MKTSVLEHLEAAVQAAFAACDLPQSMGQVKESDRPDLAPFQCNGAMAAAGFLKSKGEKSNPREIASKVCERLTQHADIASVEIAGPGFINIMPTDSAISHRAQALQNDPRVGLSKAEPETIVIDYGGPNVAKPMHVGHLRSSVIGESLKRLLRLRGHTVIGDIHLGDWGLQMGHLITELEDEQPDLPYFDKDASGPFPTQSPVTIDDLSRLYPQASSKAKDNDARMARSRTATAELQAGRPGYRALLEHFISVSIAALKEDFARLGVDFDLWKGEAAVDPLIPDMVETLKARKIAVESDGAWVIPVEKDTDKKDMPPLILVSSTGAALYATTDMATLLDRHNDIEPDRVLYVVDQRQAQHFEQVFRAVEKAGWFTSDQLEHLGFGTVNGPDGRPFKTREGGVLRLADLMEMATNMAAKRLNEAGLGANMDAAERAQIAEKVGIAAIKFADLQNQRLTNYIFDLERFTAFEGKTGPYLLYAAIRIKSLLRKAQDEGVHVGDIHVHHAAERALVLSLDHFEAALSRTLEQRAPHIMCDHVYRVAQSFSRFYADCPILSSKTADTDKSSRLALCELTLRQLEMGLDSLGISIPERM